MIRKPLRFLLVVALFGAPKLWAQAPTGTQFRYQGRLDSGGFPLTGTADFQMTLFDAAAAGNAIGATQTLSNVSIADGLFTVSLDFGASAFTGNARWLQIAVRSPAGSGAFQSLSPRQPLTATPYAVYALGAPGDGTGPWQTTGSTIHYSAGNVGIGTSSPSSLLHITSGGTGNANMRIDVAGASGTTSSLLLAGARNSGGTQFGGITFLNTDGDASSTDEYSAAIIRSFNDGDDLAGNLTFWTKGATDSSPARRMTIGATGNVGIGTSSPATRLDVNGTVTATGFVGDGSGLTGVTGPWSPNGNHISFTGGNVGIGATASNAGGWARTLSITGASSAGLGFAATQSATSWSLGMNSSAGMTILQSDANGTRERMKFDSAGGLGIGTATPAAALHVVDSTTSDNEPAIRGVHTQAAFGIGVQGEGGSIGVNGLVASSSNSGAPTFKGVNGRVTGGSAGTNYGVFGEASGGATSYGGWFQGNVNVSGVLSKSSGAFKIDHPLDPANKYLWHSFVESPDMMNIYNGNVITDDSGFATIELPDWFEALNRDFRYQLTAIGSFSRAMIAEEIHDSRFVIRTESPRIKVSWQVTGIRHDPFADANRIPVEQVKPEAEQGSYLHPALYGQPDSLRVDRFLDANAENDGALNGEKN